MWEIVLTLILAALVWLTGQFFGMPCMRFFRFRTEVRETMDFTANVSNRDMDPAKYENASEALRNVGIRIGALHETSLPPVPRVLKQLGYDLPGAKGALIGLSNSLGDKTGGRAQCRFDAEVALKLSLSYASRPVTDMSTVIPDLDVYRAASVIIKQYGSQTPFAAPGANPYLPEPRCAPAAL